VLAKRTEIEDGYQRFVEIKTLNDTLNKNLSLVNKLNQHLHELEMFVERESQTLNKEHALLQSKVAELEKFFHELPRLKEETREAQNQLQHLADEEETLRIRKEACQETIAQIRGLESDKSRLEKELAEIDDKLNLLLTQPDNAKCPVCQTELGAAGLQHISTHYNSEKQSKSDLLKSITSANCPRKKLQAFISKKKSSLEKKKNIGKISPQKKFWEKKTPP